MKAVPIVLVPFLVAVAGAALAAEAPVIDFRYAPPDWQTCIGLPDDWQKTLVGKDGDLLYDFPGKMGGFATRIAADLAGGSTWVRQELVSPRIPVVRTFKRAGDVEIQEEAFALAPPAAPTAPSPQRTDVLIVRLVNEGKSDAKVAPVLVLKSTQATGPAEDRTRASIGGQTTVVCAQPFERADASANKLTLVFPEVTLPPGGRHVMAFAVSRGKQGDAAPLTVAGAEESRQRSERYWREFDLPYGRIEAPDRGVQALLDSSIRNIYQAREIKKGLPAFQVGPTCYRGLWVVDGSFLMEAVAYLGRTAEARAGIEYLLSFQRDDGGFMLIDKHYKETGIVLWAVTRHAQLTGDREWLGKVWPRLERGWNYIREMRKAASADPKAPNAGLIPVGFSDGGLSGPHAEYTNIYWTLAGMRAAVDAARWLGRQEQAAEWQRDYDDFYAAFRRAAARDIRKDAHGNPYLPISMTGFGGPTPQKGQWAFLHAVFPGKVFAADDDLVRGNMAMLSACEVEGLVLDTGWLKNGLWNYFGSFYAHAWLWTGRPEKAIETLYAFGNHASPLLAWREEHKPQGKGPANVGDMPHNWASAEFIRLVRHLLVLERGNELHLLEGLPASWVAAGAVTRAKDIETAFGPMSLEVTAAADGRSVHIRLTPPSRTPPAKIVMHLGTWAGRQGTLDLPTGGPVDRDVPVGPPSP